MFYIDFYKMSGAGNYFILVDNRLNRYPVDLSNLAKILCDYKNGIGADGLLVVDDSLKADFKMLYFNSDGSTGGMCGNGGRCIALYMMNLLNKNNIIFEAFDYCYSAQRYNHEVILYMKKPNIFNINKLFNLFNVNIYINFIDTGAPHTVIFTDELPYNFRELIEKKGIYKIGNKIRNSDYFKPNGTNVNFCKIVSKNTISNRTYERGVEKETLACGTGSIAAAIFAVILKGIEVPVKVMTRSNNILTVNFKRNDMLIEDVKLIGPVKQIFSGRFEYNINT